jgi:hypothetical protein
VSGREIRVLEGTRQAGLNRVHWDIALPAGRAGRGARGEAPPAAAAGQAGQPQEAGRGAGAEGQRGAEPTAAPAGPAAAGRGAARGRGAVGLAVPPGAYLAKVMVGDKVIGQKTIVVEPDVIQ